MEQNRTEQNRCHFVELFVYVKFCVTFRMKTLCKGRLLLLFMWLILLFVLLLMVIVTVNYKLGSPSTCGCCDVATLCGCSTRWWHGQTLPNTAAWRWRVFHCTPSHVYDYSKPGGALQPRLWRALYEPSQGLLAGASFVVDVKQLLSNCRD